MKTFAQKLLEEKTKIFAKKPLQNMFFQKINAEKLLGKKTKKTFAEKLLEKNVRTKHLQRNLWRKKTKIILAKALQEKEW